MINCSIHNYKEWMEVYLNGNLSREDMLAVDTFLQKHPQLMDQYLLELEELSLDPENITLHSKNELSIVVQSTTNIHANNFSQYFISYHEGILSDSEKLELKSFLSSNPKLEKEFKIYGSTLLAADSSIKYPDTNSLLKRTRHAVPLFWSISAAASVLLIAGLWFFWPNETVNNGVAVGSFNKIDGGYNINEDQLLVEENNKVTQPNNTQENKKQITNSIAINQKTIRDQSIPIEIQNNNPVELDLIESNPQLALQSIPNIDTNDPLIASETKKKKGLFDKIFSGEDVFVEDYVNATFSAFKNNKEDEDKWVLKVDRDKEGKSKKVKFTSPIFSFKSKN